MFILNKWSPMIYTDDTYLLIQVLSGLVGKQICHLITGYHLCVGLTPTSDNAEELGQYDPVEHDEKLQL